MSGLTIIYPTGGDKALQIAMAILEGKPFDRETLLSTALVNSSNARVMQMQTSHIDALDHKISLLNDKLDNSMVRFYSYRIYLMVCVVLLVIVAALTMSLLRERHRMKKQGKELIEKYYSLVINPESDVIRKLNFEEEGPEGMGFVGGIDSYAFSTPADNVYNVTICTDNSVCTVYIDGLLAYTNRIYGTQKNCWSVNCYTGSMELSDVKVMYY